MDNRISKAVLAVSLAAQMALVHPAAIRAETDPPNVAFAKKKPDLPSVAILATGGTIAERTNPQTGAAVPAVSAGNLIKAVPGLAQLANISILQISNIDSSQMTPMRWARLSRALDRVLAGKDISGAIVTHGTDTMAEGAYFVDLTLKSDKPVVFTGAMNDASSPSPDGPGNILHATAQILSENAGDWGVTVTLNRYINSARDVRKTQTTNVQTFTSGQRGYLGYVFDRKVERFRDRLNRQRVPLPDPLPTAMPDIPIIKAYAGSDGRLVRHAVDTGAKGLVIEGVGAGNVNKAVYQAIGYAREKNLPVVISSSVYYGSVEPIYGDEGGGETLVEIGCILAGDLPASKARLLLMLGLLQPDMNADGLRRLFEN